MLASPPSLWTRVARRVLGRAGLAVLVSLAALAAFAVAASSSSPVAGFEPLASYKVDSAAIEIIDATPDGRTIVATRGTAVAFIDIADPRRPREAGTIALPGTATTVHVSPDGTYALAGVQTADPAGDLVIRVDLETKRVDGQVAVGEGIDSITFSPDGHYAPVAIENEDDTATAGLLQIIDLTGDDPAAWNVRDVAVPTGAGLDAPNDAQPEYVDVNAANKVVVSLQEQNGVMIVDLPTGAVERIWSAGSTNRLADLIDNDTVSLTEPYTAVRNPDAVVWTPDGDHIVETDEGEANRTGGRGFTIREPDGDIVFESGLALEQAAAARGMYPDGRSDNRGIEVHGAAADTFAGTDFAFAAAEQADFLAVYDIDDVANPELVQLLPTGGEPEAVVTIPERGLVLTSDETSGSLSIFGAVPEVVRDAAHPELLSTGAPFAAFAGLDARPDGRLAAITSDNLRPAAIWTLDPAAAGGAPTVTGRLELAGLAPGTPDPNDVAVDPSGGYWISNRSGSNARLAHVTAAGVADRQIALPASGALPAGFGTTLSGIDVSADGTKVYFSTTTGGIGELTPGTPGNEQFRLFTVARTGTRIVTDLAVTPDGDLAILESQSNHATTPFTRTISRLRLPETGTAITDKATVAVLAPDAAYASGAGYTEGLAVTAQGDVWTIRNNDGRGDHDLRERGRLLPPSGAPDVPATDGLPGEAIDAAGIVTDRAVNALVRDGDRLLLGGSFTVAGPPTGNAALLDPVTGAVKHTAFGADGAVAEAIPDGAGGFYVSGAFTTFAGTARRGVVRLRGDGTLDPAFAPVVADGAVNDIARSGSRLFLAGTFTSVGGQPRARLAAVDAATGAVDPWDPQLTATAVNELAVSGTTLYAGGTITQVAGVARGNGAAFDVAGATIAPTAWNPQANSAIGTIVATPAKVVLGGTFTQAGGQPRARLAAVDAVTGAVDLGWQADVTGAVAALALHGSTVFVGGGWSAGPDGAAGGLAAVTLADGQPVAGFDPRAQVPTNTQITALHVDGDRLLMSGTDLLSVGGEPASRLAAVDVVTGARDGAFVPAANANANAVARSGDAVFAGGSTALRLIGPMRLGAAAVDLATGTLEDWAPRVDGTVNALAVGGSRVYLGGELKGAGGNVVAVGRESGAAIASFRPGITGGPVHALDHTPGRLLVGGGFSAVGGSPVSRLVAVSPASGVRETGLDLDAYGGTVRVFARVGDRLLIGGDFRTVAGEPRVGLAALDGGELSETFAPTVDGGPVHAIEPDGLGNVYVGGGFTEVEGRGHASAARLDAVTGALDPAFAPVANNVVTDIELLGDSAVLGGWFTQVGGATRNQLAAVSREDGSLRPWAGPNLGSSLNATALEAAGGALYAGVVARVGTSVNGGLITFRGQIPVTTAPPVVSGPAVEPAALTCSTGGWSNSPTAYQYAWRRDGDPIAAATGSTYTTGPDDAGHAITCAVTARNQTGSSVPAVSASVTPTLGVPTVTAAPAIGGTAREGDALTCSTGAWTRSPTGHQYGWLVDGAPVDGADASTFIVRAGDVGRTVRCRVTASNAGGPSTPAVSDGVVPVVGAPTSTAPPVLEGAAQAGETLTCAPGAWTRSPTAFAITWLRGGAVLPGVTGPTYAVGPDDVGEPIACRVVAANAGGDSAPATSAAVVPIVAAPSAVRSPAVEGTRRVGERLTCSPGDWSEEATFTFAWLREGGAVLGTGATYTPQAGDLGTLIRCRVTASGAGGSATADSDLVAVADAVAPALEPVVITQPPAAHVTPGATTVPSAFAVAPVPVELAASTLRVTRGAAGVRLICARAVAACEGTVELVASGRTLARGSLRAGAGATRTIGLRLSERVRAALRRRGMKVTVIVVATDDAGVRRVMRTEARILRAR